MSIKNSIKRFALLSRDILSDLVKNVSGSLKVPVCVLKAFYTIPAVTFALHMIKFDNRIGASGLKSAGAWLLRKFYKGVTTAGYEFAEKGGLLIAAHHPGIGDALALFASFPRDPLTIVAKDRVFYHQLPHLRNHLVLVGGGGTEKNALGTIKELLQQGGAVLIYPAGEIEPDPARTDGDTPITKEWSNVIGLICSRAAREGWALNVQTVLASNVISERAVNSLFARTKTTRDAREKAAVSYAIATRCSKSENIGLVTSRIFTSDELAGLGSWTEGQLLLRRELESLRGVCGGQKVLDTEHVLIPVRELTGTA